ncbi:MAG: hypothetical protein GC193_10290 [Cryomorphaceae bacterium]|nr:hypothetical protein [Cryomorphaceae bacterium]
MKERNEIDRLLKDKLGEKAIAFNERHWVEMEKLLNRRKRRGVFFIFTIALLMTGIAGFALLKNADKIHISANRMQEHRVKVETREVLSILTNDFVSNEQSDETFFSEAKQQNQGANESTVSSTSALATNKRQDATGNLKKGGSSGQPENGLSSTKNTEFEQSKQTETFGSDEVFSGGSTHRQLNDQQVEDLDGLVNLSPILLQSDRFESGLAATTDSLLPPPKPFRFELIGFGAFGQQQISQAQTTENALELANYEKGRSTNYGAMFQARYKGWLAASGVEMLRIEEKVDYGSFRKEEEVVVVTTYLDSLFIGQEFTVDSIFDEQNQDWFVDTTYFDVYQYFEQTINDTTVVSAFERRKEEQPFSQVVSRVEIPILFGKAFNFGKFELNVLGGPAIAISTKVEGYVIEGSKLLERRTLSKDIALNLHLRAGLSYALNDRWALQVHTSYRRSAAAFLKYRGLEQRYAGLGIGGGVVYRFGGS